MTRSKLHLIHSSARQSARDSICKELDRDCGSFDLLILDITVAMEEPPKDDILVAPCNADFEGVRTPGGFSCSRWGRIQKSQ